MSDLVVERRDGVVTLTLDRADKLNAITSEMWDGLRDVFAEVARTHDDRVLVVTGRGRGFCAGADLLALRDPVDGADRLARMRRIGRGAAAPRAIRQPHAAP